MTNTTTPIDYKNANDIIVTYHENQILISEQIKYADCGECHNEWKEKAWTIFNKSVEVLNRSEELTSIITEKAFPIEYINVTDMTNDIFHDNFLIIIADHKHDHVIYLRIHNNYFQADYSNNGEVEKFQFFGYPIRKEEN